VSRLFVLLLLVLSVGLMGGSTCHFRASTGDKKRDGERQSGSGVELVVDTQTPSMRSDGGSGAGAMEVAVVQAALAASVAPLSSFEASSATAASGPELWPEDSVAFRQNLASARVGSLAATPEPTAVVVFAAGIGVVAWRLKRPSRLR
jgi:hypothetical protein